MKSQLQRVSVTEQSDSDTSESSAQSESSESEEPELSERIIFRVPDYHERVERASTVSIGIDPGPALCGFCVVAETTYGPKHRRQLRQEVLALVLYGANDDGTPLERVSLFAHLPWGDWLPGMTPAKRRSVHVNIEKQEQRRGKTFREDNTVLVGVLAAGARLYHVENLNIVSATVKLGKPMLEYCGMPNAVVPRGAANRLRRKKLGVEVFQAYLTKTEGWTAAMRLEQLPLSSGVYDACDAGLTAVAYFKNRDQRAKVALGKRKRE